jgi:hypothetical protein
MSNQKSIVVVSWDGKSKPLSHILFDTPPQFDFLVVDYSGEDHFNELSKITPAYYVAQKSECKGDLINNVYTYLQENKITNYDYIGLVDDDIYFSISDLNKLLFIAALEKLDVFQASLAHDSYYHHRQFIHKVGYNIQDALWVEIMSPFYSYEVFNAAGPYLNKSISGTGTDVYLIPTIQQMIGKTKTAVVHAVQMKHCRPMRTDNRVFSNQKTNLIDIADMQAFCKNMFTEFCKGAFDANQTVFVKNVLNRKYVYGIPLKYKLKRIPTMFKNLYKLLVDASYR